MRQPIEHSRGRRGRPFFRIRILDGEERPTTQREPIQLNQAWGDGKIPYFRYFDMQVAHRSIHSREIEIRPGIRISIGEGESRRQLSRLPGHLTLRHNNTAHIRSIIDVLPERGEEIEQPLPLRIRQEARIFLILACRIDTVFLRSIFDLRNIMRVFCRILRIPISPEGINPSQRVFEEQPFLLFTSNIRSIVTLYICEPRSVRRLHPHIIIRRQFVKFSGNDGVLYRNRPDSAIRKIGQGQVVRHIVSLFLHISATMHHRIDKGVISQELRGEVSHRFQCRLPRQEIRFQPIYRRIREMINPGPQH